MSFARGIMTGESNQMFISYRRAKHTAHTMTKERRVSSCTQHKSRIHQHSLKRIIFYLRLVKFLHFDIQGTGQKSHCVNTGYGHRNALL